MVIKYEVILRSLNYGVCRLLVACLILVHRQITFCIQFGLSSFLALLLLLPLRFLNLLFDILTNLKLFTFKNHLDELLFAHI